MSKLFKVHIVLFVVSVLYGLNYSIAKTVLSHYIQPFGFIFLRVSCTAVLFWLADKFCKPEKIQSKSDFIILFISACFGVAANQLLFFKGLNFTNPINASVMMTNTPVMVLLVGFIMRKEKLTIIKIVGIILAAIGAFFIITGNGSKLSIASIGDILILLNGTCFAIYLVIIKPLMVRYQPLTIIKWIFFFGMFLTLPFGIKELSEVFWYKIPIEGWASIAYVIIGATFIVYLLNMWSLKYVNTSVVGSYIYLQPLVSTLVAIFFMNEILTYNTLLFSSMIILGVYLVSKA